MASGLDSKIDDLYRAPLGEFIAARTALARTLAKDDAARVKKLAKPTVVPWAVNQVYWHARYIYDKLLKAGAAVREAQVAALGGKKADVRAAGEAHRKALAEAVQQAEKLAAASGSQPAADALMRTFEAISLAAEPPEPPGRLTKPLAPAGFEALAGVQVAGPSAERVTAEKEKAKAKEIDEADRRKADAARKKQDAEIKKAEAALERAKRKMLEAQEALKRKRGL